MTSAPAVVATLTMLYPRARTFLDVGSGSGAYAAQLRSAGLAVIALERSAAGRKMARRQGVDCRSFDLSKTPPSDVDTAFDVAYCFELAEHLPKELGERLVDFIARMTSTVVFTAAGPGQLGFGHINCQPKEYWIARFNSAGFEFRQQRTQRAAELLKEGRAVYWLVNNIMVFERAVS